MLARMEEEVLAWWKKKVFKQALAKTKERKIRIYEGSIILVGKEN